MLKIKVNLQAKNIPGKEFKPVDFFSLNKTRIIRFGVSIVVIILCLLAFRQWQENKKRELPIKLGRARELFFSGKYEAALSIYKQFPENPTAMLGAAYCYEELGDFNEAKKLYLTISVPPWKDEAVKGVERLG